MVTVQFNRRMNKYVVMRRGTVKSSHNLARRAKEQGKKLGWKFGEPVSYTPKGSTDAKFIYRPSPENQFGDSGGSSGGLLDDLL
jgi:hypothetical protein